MADVIRKYRAKIISILSVIETADEGYRHVFIRVKEISEQNLQKMIQELRKKFMLLYVTKDSLKSNSYESI